MKTILSVLAALAVAGPALAQPYPPEAPPGYYPDRGPPPGYYPDRPPPPPPGYYRERRVEFGRHCEAFIRGYEGPRRLFCRIVQEKPLGEDCACPTLPNGPGGPIGPYVGGRTVP